MLNVIKIALFVIVNIAGFYAIPVIASVAAKAGVFPSLPPGSHTEYFKWWFMGIGLWVWIACAVISVSYFFIENELKNWVLFAPMLVTALYGVAVIIYFSLFYTVA